jgi:hypothetical protein
MPRHDSRPRLLLLVAHYAPTLSYYDDWRDAFEAHPGAEVHTVDLCAGITPQALAKQLAAHDAVVLLHSTNGDTLSYLTPFTSALCARRCPLLSFVGNEVNLPGSPMAEKIAFLRTVSAQRIFTQLLLEAGEWLYAQCTASKVASIPHALQPSVFQDTTPDPQRDIDIGVRSARYTAYLGDDERNRLLAWFEDPAHCGGLQVDISTTERLARDQWAAFLNRCRGTVSNEAGGWYLERDDATVNGIRAHVLSQQRSRGGLVIAADSPLRRLGHRLPWGLRALLRRLMRYGPVRHEAAFNEEIDFDAIYQRFFADTPRAPVYAKAISSRHFDAIGTGTCQIMLRGRYNDILQPDVHYLALDEDLGNVEDVLRRFADAAERQRIREAAHQLAMTSHTYEHRVSQVLRHVEASL